MSISHVITEPTEWSIDRVGIRGKLFPASALVERSEHLLIETETGHETTIIEQVSDFIYYVLDGVGSFVVNGVLEPCAKGDLVVIPHGARFSYSGRLRMFLTCSPPWSAEQETTL